MGGSLLALVAVGSQDSYLSLRPQVTFFRGQMRRYSMFSFEDIEQTLNGSPGLGRRQSAQISRNGDLLMDLYIRAKLPTPILTSEGSTPIVADDLAAAASAAFVPYVGIQMIRYVELEIGGSRVDKLYPEYMMAMQELSTSASHRVGVEAMCGNVPNPHKRDLYIPLPFYFCTASQALPLVSIAYHEVRVTIETRPLSELVLSKADLAAAIGIDISDPADTDIAVSYDESTFDLKLFGTYVFCESTERRRLAINAQEQLVTQVQEITENIGMGSTSKTIRVNWNHPVGAWYLMCQSEDNIAKNLLLNFENPNETDEYKCPVENMKLRLNGHDKMVEMPGSYFNLWAAKKFHTAIPEDNGILVYSHCLSPETMGTQPTGSINYSRLDASEIALNFKPSFTAAAGARIRIYARNVNIARITGGMYGVAYSN